MADKLKCPFCGSELYTDHIGFYACPTVHCALWECEGVPQKVIKSLIDGKKTQDAIQEIKDIVYPALDKEFYSELRDDMLYIGRIIVSVEKQELNNENN